MSPTGRHRTICRRVDVATLAAVVGSTPDALRPVLRIASGVGLVVISGGSVALAPSVAGLIFGRIRRERPRRGWRPARPDAFDLAGQRLRELRAARRS